MGVVEGGSACSAVDLSDLGVAQPCGTALRYSLALPWRALPLQTESDGTLVIRHTLKHSDDHRLALVNLLPTGRARSKSVCLVSLIVGASVQHIQV
jgi:hypothetical protein